MWAVSLCCNITALIVPFMEINIFLKSTEVYSLPHSVKLMWDAKLYVVAGLILGFSIIFPFIKLSLIALIWFVITNQSRRHKLIEWLEQLGKWSMLDIFVVCIILVLTNDQFFISSEIRFGVYFFLAAIFLSMITSLLIKHLAERMNATVSQSKSTPDISYSLMVQTGWLNTIIPMVWMISAIALGSLYVAPFIKIEGFFFNQHAFNIFTTSMTLWGNGEAVLAGFVFLTLILLPVFAMFFLLIVWLGWFHRRTHEKLAAVLDVLTGWSMLDVFGLSLLIFLLEGKRLIYTKAQAGLFVLCGVIALMLFTFWLIKGISKRQMRLLESARCHDSPPGF